MRAIVSTKYHLHPQQTPLNILPFCTPSLCILALLLCSMSTCPLLGTSFHKELIHSEKSVNKFNSVLEQEEKKTKVINDSACHSKSSWFGVQRSAVTSCTTGLLSTYTAILDVIEQQQETRTLCFFLFLLSSFFTSLQKAWFISCVYLLPTCCLGR